MIVLRTPNDALRLEMDDRLYRALWFYTGALFTLITETLVNNYGHEEYQPKFGNIVRELIGDQYGHAYTLPRLLDRVKDPKLADIDADTDVSVNFNCLPDQPGEIEYDPLLKQIQGAVHGLVQFFAMPESGFYSPGNVVDIKQFLKYCALERRLIGPPEAAKAFDEIYDIFTQAALGGEGLIQELADILQEVEA